MEGNFCSIYQSISSLFACKRVGQTQSTKRAYLQRDTTWTKVKQRSGVEWSATKVQKQLTLQYYISIKGHAAYSWLSGYFQPSSFFLSINKHPPHTHTPSHSNPTIIILAWMHNSVLIDHSSPTEPLLAVQPMPMCVRSFVPVCAYEMM